MSEAKSWGYKRYDAYCPGHIMESITGQYFSYHHPNSENGQHSSDYGGHHWQGHFQVPHHFWLGSENSPWIGRAKGMAERGSVLMKSGAKLLQLKKDNLYRRHITEKWEYR